MGHNDGFPLTAGEPSPPEPTVSPCQILLLWERCGSAAVFRQLPSKLFKPIAFNCNSRSFFSSSTLIHSHACTRSVTVSGATGSRGRLYQDCQFVRIFLPPSWAAPAADWDPTHRRTVRNGVAFQW